MKQVNLSQGDVCYEERGSGRPVVFVHGALVNGSLWSGVVRALQSTHRCIVPEWPLGSHRVPMRPDADLSPEGMARLVAELIRALGLEDVTLVGNDSGGAVCQLVAARHGDAIDRLVLTNCDALDVFPPAPFEFLKLLPRVPGLHAGLAKSMLRFPSLRRLPMAYGLLARAPIDAGVSRSWVEPGARDARIRRDAAKFLRGVTAKLTQTAAAELGRFEKPVLLLWGDADRFFRISLARRLQRCFDNAHLQTIRSGRTFVPLDAPDDVAAGIRDFVQAAVEHGIPHAGRVAGAGA